jgi:hypothetical protein
MESTTNNMLPPTGTASPAPRKSSTTIIVLIAVAALAVLCVCCMCSVAGWFIYSARTSTGVTQQRGNVQQLVGRVEAQESFSAQYDVSGQPTLELDVNVGAVTIKPGTGSRIEISGVKHAFAATQADAENLLQQYQVETRQEGDRVVVTASDPGGVRTQSPRVDLEISVPSSVKVIAVVKVGELRLNDLSGEFDLATNVGEIQALDLTLTGASRMTTDVGNVTVRVPANSSFELDARTSIGTVQSDFDVQGAGTQGGSLLGKSLQGKVGKDAAFVLTLRASTGEINLQHGK